MPLRSLSKALLPGLALLVLATAAHAGSLRKDVLDALKESNVREGAILLETRIAGEDSAAAADLLIDQVVRKERPEVIHEVAIGALARMETAEALERIVKEAREGKGEARLRVLEALGRSEKPKAHWTLLDLAHAPEPEVRTAAASALAFSIRKDDRETFEELLGDPSWTVRSVAAGALFQMSGAEYVPALALALTGARGRMVDDLTLALQSVSGQSFGPHPQKYLDWYGKEVGKTGHKAEWSPPPPSFTSPSLTSRSERVLFVLSVGETMKQKHGRPPPSDALLEQVRAYGPDLAEDLEKAETKLDVAKVHLRCMLRSLRDGVQFDVMVYAASPSLAFGAPTDADDRSRKRAEGRVQGLSPSTGANLHGALVKAFAPKGKDPFVDAEGPDTIVLVTDGSLGKPGSEDRLEVGLAVGRWNAVRQVRFLVVAVGQAETSFLAGLGGATPRHELVTVP